MAVLKEPEHMGFEIEQTAPEGTFIATCLDVHDQFEVERAKFEDPTQKQVLDVTRFLFGFAVAETGAKAIAQTYEFRISGSPRSNLFKFLTAWLGKAPAYQWDYCDMIGRGGIISVEHKESRDGTRTYATVISAFPLIDQVRSQVIPLRDFVTAGLIPGPDGGLSPEVAKEVEAQITNAKATETPAVDRGPATEQPISDEQAVPF